MGPNELGGGQGGGVVLAYGNPELLLLAVRHQPGLMDPLGGDILQLWNPCPDVLTIQIIVLHPYHVDMLRAFKHTQNVVHVHGVH